MRRSLLSRQGGVNACVRGKNNMSCTKSGTTTTTATTATISCRHFFSSQDSIMFASTSSALQQQQQQHKIISHSWNNGRDDNTNTTTRQSSSLFSSSSSSSSLPRLDADDIDNNNDNSNNNNSIIIDNTIDMATANEEMYEDLFANAIAPTAKESLRRLIQLQKVRQHLDTTTNNNNNKNNTDDDNGSASSSSLSKLEYRVLRQVLHEKDNHVLLLQEAAMNYLWPQQAMWNHLLSYEHPKAPEYAWHILGSWKKKKKKNKQQQNQDLKSILPMYQWGLSALAHGGHFQKCLSILRYLEAKKADTILQEEQQVVDLFACYNSALQACYNHVVADTGNNNGNSGNDGGDDYYQTPPTKSKSNSFRIARNASSSEKQQYQELQKAAKAIFDNAAPYHHHYRNNDNNKNNASRDFYKTYLSILANDPVSVGMGRRALNVLDGMATMLEDEKKKDDNNTETIDPTGDASTVGVKPDLLCYNLVLKALAKEGDHKSATRVLKSMIQWSGELFDTKVKMDYHNDVDHDDYYDIANAATTTFSSQNSNNDNSINKNTPNLLISFHTVLKAFYEAKSIQAAEQAEDLVEIMWKVANIRKRPDFEPTARTYGQVIAIWTQLGRPQRAMTLLEELQNLYKQNKTHNEKFFPDVICYRTVIGGLSKVDPITVEIAEQATLVLRNMYDLGHAPNLVTINTVLKCLANAGRPRDAEKLMDEIINSWGMTLDIVSYNTIIGAYGKLSQEEPGSLDRARELLDRLLNNKHKNSSSNRKQLPRPNTITFTAVIGGLSKQRTVASAELAERLLLQMQELHEDSGDDTKPNMLTYNNLLNCWAHVGGNEIGDGKSGGGARAETILRGMQDNLPKSEHPNTISYNTVIWAYRPNSGKAEELVQDMTTRGIRPNDVTRNTVRAMIFRDDDRFKTKNEKMAKARELDKLYFQHVRLTNNKKKESTKKR